VLHKRKKRSKKAVAVSILTHPDVVVAAAVGLGVLDGRRRDDPAEEFAAGMLGLFYTTLRPALLYYRQLSRGD
jgi:hypothetical protein